MHEKDCRQEDPKGRHGTRLQINHVLKRHVVHRQGEPLEWSTEYEQFCNENAAIEFVRQIDA